MLRALESICKNAGFSTKHKMVPRVRVTDAQISKSSTSAWHRCQICWWTSPCATISSALVKMGGEPTASYATENPAQILESTTVQKIRDYRNTYRRNRQVAFLPA